MTQAQLVPQPGRQGLAAELTEVETSLAAFTEAMHGVNDEALIDAFRDLLSVAPPIIASHKARIGLTLADDMATLNSLVARYPIPREDPDLGRTDRLKTLRSARGNLVADIETVLHAAAALGLHPTRPEIELPTAVVVERAGLEALLSGMVRRLNDVEQGLKQIVAEKEPETLTSVRQNGLINVYINSMNIELALAKLEASAKKLIDLSGLGRAVEAIGTLTTDFIATTRGMVRTIGTGLRRAAEMLRPTVGRLVSGMKTLSQRLARTGISLQGSPTPATVPPPDADASSIEQFWRHIEAGDHHVRSGSLSAAKGEFLDAEEIAIRETDQSPNSLQWRRNLSVSHNKLGDLARASGDPAEAHRRFTAGRAIAERLAASDPGNSEWQRDLSVSHDRLGDLARASGDLAEAHRRFIASLDIRERLAASDPGNSEWQRDLSISHDRLGDLARASGDLAEARRRFTASLAIAERLAANDPGNSEWQRDLSISHDRLGDLARASGDLAEAHRRFTAGLAIAERLAASDPGNSEWQRDLSISHNKLGDLARARGDLAEARRRFTASLAIADRLAANDPGNSEWQRDLSISHNKLGDLARASGDLAEAHRRFTAGLAIAERLAASDPGNSEWQRDVWLSQTRVGDVAETEGDTAAATALYRTSLPIIEALAAQSPDMPERQNDLAYARRRLGELEAKAGG